jgi:transketolase N-terminal domain/subunit
VLLAEDQRRLARDAPEPTTTASASTVPTELSFSEDTTDRLEANGWRVETVDGHDVGAVADGLVGSHKR